MHLISFFVGSVLKISLSLFTLWLVCVAYTILNGYLQYRRWKATGVEFMGGNTYGLIRDIQIFKNY